MNQMPDSIILNTTKKILSRRPGREEGTRQKRTGREGGGSWKSGIRERVRKLRKLRSS